MIIVVIVACVFFLLWRLEVRKRKTSEQQLGDKLSAANSRIAFLSKYETIADAEAYAGKIKDDADLQLRNAKDESTLIIKKATDKSDAIVQQATERLQRADADAERILSEAQKQAREIAGSALDDKAKAEEYKAQAEAMRHVIEGYGDEWLKPSYSVLDELADEFGYAEAGVELKKARLHSAEMVKDGRAAKCDYVNQTRSDTAVAFVIDAFNGKVDSILSKVRHDNHGKLERMIKDAYTLVNSTGAAFRNARITEEYLTSRLNELHWAVVVNELKKQEQEQQRLIREQMREEELARREYEKAKKEAEKEAAMLSKAMEKAKAMLAKANETEKAKYEGQIADLEAKLKEAEEKNQRALSMAQQTRRGSVYVISNIGSFGENVYKVGMTRRLDPLDRVRELGDASVPFPFDVHAIIESDDAPALETALHKELSMMQVNKVNPHKEFFRVPIADIKKLIENRNIEVVWTMTAEAAEYRESLAIEKAGLKPAE